MAGASRLRDTPTPRPCWRCRPDSRRSPFGERRFLDPDRLDQGCCVGSAEKVPRRIHQPPASAIHAALPACAHLSGPMWRRSRPEDRTPRRPKRAVLASLEHAHRLGLVRVRGRMLARLSMPSVGLALEWGNSRRGQRRRRRRHESGCDVAHRPDQLPCPVVGRSTCRPDRRGPRHPGVGGCLTVTLGSGPGPAEQIGSRPRCAMGRARLRRGRLLQPSRPARDRRNLGGSTACCGSGSTCCCFTSGRLRAAAEAAANTPPRPGPQSPRLPGCRSIRHRPARPPASKPRLPACVPGILPSDRFASAGRRCARRIPTACHTLPRNNRRGRQMHTARAASPGDDDREQRRLADARRQDAPLRRCAQQPACGTRSQPWLLPSSASPAPSGPGQPSSARSASSRGWRCRSTNRLQAVAACCSELVEPASLRRILRRRPVMAAARRPECPGRCRAGRPDRRAWRCA